MIRKILSYNFPFNKPDDYQKFFECEQRNACFAAVFKENETYTVIRDQLGTVPLFFRKINGKWKFSFHQSSLILNTDKIDSQALNHSLIFSTSKIDTLVKKIHSAQPGSVTVVDGDKVHVVYKYKFKPEKISWLCSTQQVVETFNRLFYTAVISQLGINKTAGIYLSGGSDSAIIGKCLADNGVNVNAYSVDIWGNNSEEIKLAQDNARIIKVKKHYVFHPIINKKTLQKHLDQYDDIHLTPASLAVAELWDKTKISQEKIIFHGQNSDTLFCSVNSQNDLFFLSKLPNILRRMIAKTNFSAYIEKTFIDYLCEGTGYEWSSLVKNNNIQTIKNDMISNLTIMGMLLGHTPSDSEVLNAPAISKGITIANPYYNVDLIEFIMGLPLRYRVSFSLSKNTKFYLDKKILKISANRYFSTKVTGRKKGFTLPVDETIKSVGNNIKINNPIINLRMIILNNWLTAHKIKHQKSNK